MKNRIISLFLTLTLLFAFGAVLTACNPSESEQATDAATGGTVIPNITAPKVDTKVMVLNGTTGFGMATLMEVNSKGNAQNTYTFSVESDASNITAALINGSVDIAALPTNAAAALNAKKPGAIKVLAVNTLGVLYLMSSDNETITSMEDLRGKTVYCPAQNPTFIFSYLCKENGLVPGTDVTIDSTSYAQPADLRTALVAGKVDIAVLPEPMVTIAKNANDKLSVDLDLTVEWDKCATPGSLAQGCVVVRTEFANEHPEAITAFLSEYKASIDFVKETPDQAAQYIAAHGIFAQAPVAEKAIPNCNLCFLTGEEMAAKLTEFYTILHGIAPAAVGNAIPGNDLYYIPEA